jgi:hypothetical protein
MPMETIYNQEAEKVKEEILAPGKIKHLAIMDKVAEMEAQKGQEKSKVDEQPKKEIVEVEETDEETKAEKFVRLVQIRVSRILDDIDVLANLANSNYEYTPEQISKIFTAILDELTKTRTKFLNHNTLRFTL